MRDPAPMYLVPAGGDAMPMEGHTTDSRISLPTRLLLLIAAAWVALFAVSAPADAAIARIQTSPVGTGGGTSVTATYSTPTTSGNLLVATVMDINGGCSATTFSAPAGWTRAATVCRGSTGPIQIWYRANAPSGITGVTFTTGNAGANSVLQLTEWSGAATSAVLDLIGTNSSASSSTTPTVTTSGNVTSSGELAVSLFQTSGGLTSLTPGSGWTALGTSAGTGYISDYRIGPPTGSTLTSTITANPGTTWGAVIATFKVPAAPSATIDLATSSNIAIRIDGAAADNESGWATESVGDMNGDGIDDIFVGAPSFWSGGVNRGYVVWGGGAPRTVDLNALGSNGFVINGLSNGSSLGRAVAAVGDLNGDGRGDVAISAHLADNNGRADSGSVYVVFGKATTTTVNVGTLGSWGYRVDGAAAGDYFGATVGAGDVNGDGLRDLVVTAPYADNNARTDSGSAYVVFGKSSTTTVDTASLGTSGWRIDGATANVLTGYRGANAGDVTGDGLADVFLSTPYADYNGRTDSGSVWVIKGKAGTGNVDLASLGTAGFRVDGHVSGDELQTAAPLGDDLNGDGIDDFVVGAPWAWINENGVSSGAAYVVWGRTATSSVDLSALGSSGYRITGVADVDGTGMTVAPAGDLNGDGIGDIYVGAYLSDNNGRANSGSAYLLFGKADTAEVKLNALGTGGFRIDGAAANDNFGASENGEAGGGIGDQNGDGRPDLLAASNFADPSARTSAGQTYVVSPTLAMASATTGAATSVATTSATLNGTGNPNGQAATYWFEYGTSASYGSTTSSASLGSGTANVAVAANLTGLSTGTTYHFRLVVQDSDGYKSYGADTTFLPQSPPTSTTTVRGGSLAWQSVASMTVSANTDPYGTTGASTSTLSRYHLNGAGTDDSGNGHTMSLFPTYAWTTDRFGNGNSAIDFQSSGYGDVTGITTGGAMTVAGWVRWNSLGSYSRFFDFGNGWGYGALDTIWVGNVATTNTLRYCIEDADSPTYSHCVDAPNAITTGQWMHVAATVDLAGAMKLYINGTQVGSTSGVAPLVGVRTHNYFGKSTWSADAPFNGRMDDILIAHQALSATDIATIAGASGILRHEYRSSTDGGSSWGSATTGASATVTAEGETLLQFRSVANDAQTSAWVPATATADSTVRIDRSPPTDAAVSGGSLTWQNVAGITFTASGSVDAGPGLGAYDFRTSSNGGSTWSSPVLGGGWGSSTSLTSSGAFMDSPKVGIDASGNAVAAWREHDGSNYLIMTAHRPAGGSWSAPTALTSTGFDASAPLLSVASDGTAMVGWTRSDGATLRMQVKRGTTAGVWGSVTNVSNAGVSALYPALAMNDAGVAVAAWYVSGTGLRAARFDGTTWETPQTVRTGTPVYPDVAINASGEIGLVWDNWNGSNSVVEAATRSGGGAWSASTALSAAGQDAGSATVTVTPDGTMVAAWQRSDGVNTIVQTSVRPAAGAWGAAQDRSAAGQDAGAANLAALADGRVLLAWDRTDGTAYRVQAAERSAAGTWGATATLSDVGENGFGPNLATSAGAAVLSWYRWDGSRYRIQAVTQPAAGTWSSVDTLSATGVSAYQNDAAMAPDGTVVTVWYRTTTPRAIESAVRSVANTLEVTAEGETIVQARASDRLGNTGSWAPATSTAGSTARIDRTSPSDPTVSGGSLTWQNVASVSITGSASTDAHSGVASYAYRTSTDGGSTWSAATTGPTVVVSAEGETLVQFRSTDNAGNTSAWAPATPTAGSTVRIDRTAPTTPTVGGGSTSWQSVASVNIIGLGSTDALSGVSGYQYRTSTDGGSSWTGATSGNSANVTAEGETLVQFRSVDGAGNTSAWTPASATAGSTARIDRTAPTGPTVSGGSLAWQNVASVTVTGSGSTDVLAGLSGYQYRTSADGGSTWGGASTGSSAVITAAGETLVQFRALDNAGNAGAWTPATSTAGSTVRISRFAELDLGNGSNVHLRIDGATAGDHTTEYSRDAAGDVNGDGIPDVLVGARFADNNGRADSGSAYVVFGTATSTTVDLAALGTKGFRIDGAAAGDGLGQASVGLTDLNWDGYEDIAIAAPGADNNGRAGSGSVYVIYGKADSSTIDLANTGTWTGYRIDGQAAGDAFGSAVAAVGEVNVDGTRDMVVVAPGADNNGRSNSGSAYVVYGKWTPANVDTAALGTDGYRIDGAQAGAPIEWASGGHAADVNTPEYDANGDGAGDVLIGAGGMDNNGRTDSGSVYVVYGLTTPANIDLAALGGNGYRIDGALAGDAIGAGAVSIVGDVNGDMLADALIGSPTADRNGRTNSGSAWIVFGRSDGAWVDLASLGTAGYRIDGAQAGDALGGDGGRVGDVNNDGLMDTIIGASGVTANGRSASGAAYVLFGRTATTTMDLSTMGTAGFRIDGATAGEGATGRTELGDLNGDGLPELLVASPLADPSSRTDAGAAWVVSPALVLPSAVTDPATAVTQTSATLNGTVNPRGQAATTWFEYGTTLAYGNSTTVTSAGSGTADVAASAGITGLTADTTYRYRVVVEDADGYRTYGDPGIFRTDLTPPTTPTARGGSLSWQSAASVTVTGEGGTENATGLRATYYNGQNLSGPVALVRTENVDFDWAYATPDPLVTGDTFSVRWDGGVTAPTTGAYTFRTVSDDGVRLWVDGQLLIDNWDTINAWPDTQTSVTVNLVAGQTSPIRLEYRDGLAYAIVQLQWQTPAGGGYVAIPKAQLTPVTHEYRTSTDGGSTWSAPAAGSLAAVTAEGETLVQYRATDADGNTSGWGPASATAGSTVRLDRTAPTAPTVSGGSLSWQSVASVAVTASGSDGGLSGLAGYEYRTSTDGGSTWSGATSGASVSITAEGETLVQYRAIDGAGNTSAWTPASATAGSTARIDRTAPTAPTVSGGSPLWQSVASVAVSGAGSTDGHSGVDHYEYRTSTDDGSTWSAPST
ncbi:MAG: FG-GAP repeat protein, partial [Thermoleophilia bacterium]|nr:FG-GAP repeat protein [Thermoleophilia bacterium]